MKNQHIDATAFTIVLRILAHEIESHNRIASAVMMEAAERLGELSADIAVVLPAISKATGKASRRSKKGKALRAAGNRLAAAVLAVDGLKGS
jgi:hypothetical protein